MSQTAIPVGTGSYASAIPTAYQYSGGFYSMTAQQVVNDYTNLHLATTATNRPIPSSKWWTDILVGDRSYQATAGSPRVMQQDPMGANSGDIPMS